MSNNTQNQVSSPEKTQNTVYDENTPLYFSNGIKTYIMLIKSRYSQVVNIEELLEYAGMTMAEINADGHKFSQKQINRFTEKLIELTGNENIGEEAGRFTTSPEALGILRSYFYAFGSPLKAFRKLNELAKKVSLSSTYAYDELGPNKIKVTVTPHKGVKEEKFQCDNRIGYFKGIFDLFGMEEPIIDHPECLSQNKGKSCQYIITWGEAQPLLKNIRILRSVFYSFLAIGIFLSFFNIGQYQLVAFLAFAFFTLLFELLISKIALEENQKLVKRYSEELQEQYQGLYNELNTRYDLSQIVKELGVALSEETSLEGTLDKLSDVLENRLEYSRGAIMIANEDKTRLGYKKGFGYKKKELEYWKLITDFYLYPESKGPFVRSFFDQKPRLVDDIMSIIGSVSLRSMDLIQKFKVESLLVCPIVYQKESLGIFAVENFKNKRSLNQNDMNILMGVASQIAIKLNHIRVTEKHLDEITDLAVKAKKKILKEKEDLIMRAVHNIITPATSNDMNIMYLLEDCELTNESRELLEEISRQNDRILQLAHDFMLFLKPITHRLKLVDIRLLANKVFERVRDKIENNKINFLNDIQLPKIHCDDNGMEWAFEELIRNATKHGADEIRFYSFIEGDRAEITVENNGQKIEKDHTEKIFEPYFSTTSMGGTGIGLSNIKKIVEEHNGQFYLDSSNERATRFVIKLPLKLKSRSGDDSYE